MVLEPSTPEQPTRATHARGLRLPARGSGRVLRRLLAIAALAIAGALGGLLAEPPPAHAVCSPVCVNITQPPLISAPGNLTMTFNWAAQYNQGLLLVRICDGSLFSVCVGNEVYTKTFNNVGIFTGSAFQETINDSWNFPEGTWIVEGYAASTDQFGNPVGSTSRRTINVCAPGNCTPTASTLVYPSSGGWEITQPTLLATFEDPDVGDTGHVEFELCTTSSCSTVVTSGSSGSNLPVGAMGSWQVDVPLTPETLYYWRARSVDASARVGPWSSARSVRPKTDTARLVPDGIVSNTGFQQRTFAGSCIGQALPAGLGLLGEDAETPDDVSCGGGNDESSMHTLIGDTLVADLSAGPGSVQTVDRVLVKVAARTGPAGTQGGLVDMAIQRADGSAVGSTTARAVGLHNNAVTYAASISTSLSSAELAGLRVVVGGVPDLSGPGEEVRIDAVSVDVIYTPAACGPCPPDTPTAVSPTGGNWVTSLPTLTSSGFADPDGPATQQSAQWQVTSTSGDYTSPDYDSGETTTDLTSHPVPPAAGLIEGTPYYWRVRHRSTDGTWSSWSSEASFLLDTAPPDRISGITRSSRSTSAVGVTWDQGTDNATTGTSIRYQTEQSTDGSTWSPRCTNSTNETCTASGLSLGQQAYLRIRAVDLAGNVGPWAYYADVSTAVYWGTETSPSTKLTSGSVHTLVPTLTSLTSTVTSNLNGQTGYWQFQPGAAGASSASLPAVPNPATTGRGWYLDSSAVAGIPTGIADGDVKGIMQSTASKVNGTAYARMRVWSAPTSGGSLAPGAVKLVDDIGVSNQFGTTNQIGSQAITTFATPQVWGDGGGIYFETWLDIVTPSGSPGGAMTVTASDIRVTSPPPGPVPELASSLSPADSSTPGTDTLSATYTHLAGVPGHLKFELAPDNAGSPGSVAEVGYSAFELSGAGTTGTYDPYLSNSSGTYWWRVTAQDRYGRIRGTSSWRSFTVGGVNAAPTASTLVSPADAADVADTTPQLQATFEDADTPETGLVRFEVCSVATSAGQSCTGAGGSVAATGTSAAGLAPGATGSWSPASALTTGTWYWHARGEDDEGATGPWSATRSIAVGTGSLSVSVGSPTLALGDGSGGADLVGTLTVDLSTTYVDGWQLSATDEHDSWGLSVDGLGAVTLPDAGGPDANPATADGPAVWAAGAAGFGVSVLDVSGSIDQRDAMWGTATTTGFAATNFTDNYFAGLSNTTEQVLAQRSGYAAGTDQVQLAIRTTTTDTTPPGDYVGVVTFTAVPLP